MWHHFCHVASLLTGFLAYISKGKPLGTRLANIMMDGTTKCLHEFNF